MKRLKLFPEGMQLISIPFNQRSSMLETLREMPWVPPPLRPDGLEYVKKLRSKLGLDRLEKLNREDHKGLKKFISLRFNLFNKRLN
jgi:hypothetical protein